MNSSTKPNFKEIIAEIAEERTKRVFPIKEEVTYVLNHVSDHHDACNIIKSLVGMKPTMSVSDTSCDIFLHEAKSRKVYHQLMFARTID